MLNSIKDRNGKEREVIILTESEKNKRRDLKEKLEMYIEPEKNVYSFVKGKSVKAAIEFIRGNIDKYDYFLKADIERYFESIEKEKVLEILESYGVEYNVVNRVRETLEIEESLMERGGIALGSPLSNYLSNIYLKDLDRLFLERAGVEYIRFCDDIFILSKNKNVLEELRKYLGTYNLKLNEGKCFLGSFGDRVKFLGEDIEKKGDKLEGLVYRYIEEGESEEKIVEELVEEFDFETIDKFLERIKNEDDEEKLILEKFKMVDYFYEADNDGEANYKRQNIELSIGDIREHTKGNKSIAVSLLREDYRSNIGVIDVDEDLKIENINIEGYIEKTGGKGYHIWFFFKTFYKVDEIEKYLNKIREEYFESAKVEIFPKKNYLEEKENIVKLPLGIHPKYLNESKFLNLASIEEIKEIEIKAENERFESFLEGLREEYEEGYNIVIKCNKLKFIIEKGFEDLEMEHYKRLVILYTLHFVNGGDSIIHDIMSVMDNYSFNKTEKFIAECFDNTISCKKICSYLKRENIECLCDFKENSLYKTPLNLIKDCNGELEKEIEEIIRELSELKKEKLIIEKKINKIQKRMEFLFDKNSSDEIKTSMGNLKSKDGEFFIEIRF